MKIIFDDYETEAIATQAKIYNVNIEAIIDMYVVRAESNFDQDIIDILNDEADDLRKEYGEFDEEK